MNGHDIAFTVIPGVIALGFAAKIYFYFKDQNNWKKMPTILDYTSEHPDCRSENGIKCCYCGSKSIRNWGLNSPNDDRRVFICNHCGSDLYRSL
ncbi:MAG: hypothetical protein ACPGAE_02915 [Neptuniibacter sp.]